MTVGERGPHGDHGQHGDAGEKGQKGDKGDEGPRGRPYASILTRHAIHAYLVLAFGVVLALAFTWRVGQESDRKIRAAAHEQCLAFNTRSEIAQEEYTDNRQRAERFDYATTLNLTAEQGENVRTLSLESIERRLRLLPFLDCDTGVRITVDEYNASQKEQP